MAELCLEFFTPNEEDTWISRGDAKINVKAHIWIMKSETEKIEIIKKVLEVYAKRTEYRGQHFTYEELLNCLEYYGADISNKNVNELEENFYVVLWNAKDFYTELEWRDDGHVYELFINCVCSKDTNIICESIKNTGGEKRTLELKNFRAYDGHKMEASINLKKYKKLQNKKDYFRLKNIFQLSNMYLFNRLIDFVETNYNYELIFPKIHKKYEDEYNYLMKNSKDYKIDCTLIESTSEVILKVSFKPCIVK